MLKKLNYFIILTLFIFIQTITNSLAFHKHDADNILIQEKDSEGLKRKILQQKYCTSAVKKITTNNEEKKKPDNSESKEENSESNEKKENKTPSTEIVNKIVTFNVEHPHSKFKDATEILNFSEAKKIKINDLARLISEKLTVNELLSFYCLQEKAKESQSTKFETNKKINDLYDKIAQNNGLVDKNTPIGQEIYNKGEIFIETVNKEGSNIELVYSEAQFITNEIKKVKEKEKKAADKKKKAEAKKKAEEARKKAIQDGNDQWISENKQDFIEKLEEKLNDFANKITKLETKRSKLNQKVEDFKTIISDANEEVENAISDLVNKGDEEIKILRDEIRENKKTYLSDSDLQEYKDRLAKIKKIKFKKYKNYTTLQDLKKRAEKSKKVKNFVGKKAVKIGKITFKQKTIGFIQEYENLKDKDLGSKTHSKNMDSLNDDINKHKENIDEFIFNRVSVLRALDEAIERKTPWGKYATYFAIFLTIVGAGAYIFIQQNSMKKLREEAEQKVGSLKSDLEGKLKDTSEQIKSVKTSSFRKSEESQAKTEPVIKEEPKTPEQIIADKYDELISDYNDALNDFSKVAGFKQKWNGLALSRKERQEGTKTVLISSSRAFEKAGIWCVTFSDKYFGLPGLSVKTNMATYMNLNFMKADQDFKGVFSISEGSNYSTEPCVLRKGGAGFVVERSGKIIFPN